MRNLRILDNYRVTSGQVIDFLGSEGDHTCGAFVVPGPRGDTRLRIIASTDGGWDHVSVSLETRAPTWEEMEHVKRMFFTDTEIVVQFHVPPKDHINFHPFTLHLWRPQKQPVPTPPKWMVGPQLIIKED